MDPLTSEQFPKSHVPEEGINENHSTAEDFWQEYLKGVDPQDFPPRPAQDKTHSSTDHLQNPCDIPDAFNSRESFQSAIILAWALIVSQYTDSEEALFGLVASGQDISTDSIESPPVPVTPFRAQVRPHESVHDALSRTRLQRSQMVSFQDAGLERIRAINADTARACQFQNALAIVSRQHHDASDICRSSLAAISNSPLTVLCEVDDPCRLVMVSAAFDSERITSVQVRWVLEQFTHNLCEILLQEKTLAAITEVCPNHLDILTSWYPGEPGGLEESVHELILKTCTENPNFTAVSAWDGDLTYKELDDLSSALAARLQKHSVGRSAYVPVYSEKSKHVVVAMLAIMRVGGAFLLLSESQPLVRVKEFCEKVKAPVVLTSVNCKPRLSQLDLPTITLEESIEQGNDDGLTTNSVSVSVGPDDPVYIVFTSGSTGTPKGVVIGHSALSTNAVRLGKDFGCRPKWRWLTTASLAFDMSIMEMIFPLMHAGCTCMPDESELSNDYEKVIQDYQPEMLSMTPTRARNLMPEKIRNVQTMIVGGEKLLQCDVKTWAADFHLQQAYGPAECTLISSKTTMMPDADPANMGHATNCNLWIVDHQDLERLLPIGCPGELLIEGPIVGQGYLNDPERSAASFVQPPKWLQRMRGGQGRRCYRTGDIVTYSSSGDGSVSIIGRKDNQVKLRGQRIEMGEVEAQIRTALPDASAVVVDIISPENADDQKALTAFILQQETVTDDNDILFAPAGDASFSAAATATREYLQCRLPPYMVPAVFLPLLRLPRSTSDKTDRLLLRKKASDLPRRTLQAYRIQASAPQKPRNRSEEMVQEMVAAVLKLDVSNMSMDDDIFYLGADSIAVTRLVKSARDRGMTLLAADVYRFSRLKDIAERMQAQQQCPGETEGISPFSLISSATREEITQVLTSTIDGEASEIEDIYPCTPLQEALLALSAMRKDAVAERFSVELQPDISFSRFRQAWGSVVRANPILRTRFVTDGLHRTFQVVLSKSPKWTEDEDVTLPEVGPGLSLISFGLETDPENSTVHFVLAMHHTLYDGWSYSSLLDQIEDAYCGSLIRTAPFNMFVRHVTSLESGVAKEYWERQMAGYDSMPYPARPSATTAPFPSSCVEERIALRAVRGITKASFINLGWAIVLSQLTDSDDIVFGCTATGRDAPVEDIEVVNGPVVAVVPLRIQLRQDHVAMDALKRVQLQTADVARFQHWGMQNIRKVSREAEAACQFQNLVVTQTPSDDSRQSQVFTTANDVDRDNSQFYTHPLVLLCFQFNDHIDARLRFDPTIIAQDQAQAIVKQFSHVLSSLQAQPDQRIADIPSITQRDMEVLRAWGSPAPVASEACVHHLFENIVQENPKSLAISSWDGSFTYRDLNEMASRLAKYLAEQNVGPDTFVPICLERSRWVAVAILGVMKAGGAFVLLEPSQPMQRLQGICTEVGARIAISSHQAVPSCSDLPVSIVSISNDETEWQDKSTVRSSLGGQEAVASNALYAVFTSGSTGKPKGVVVQHSAYCTMLEALLLRTGLSREMRYFHYSSFAFDAAITDFLAPLTAGACLRIPSANERSNDLAGVARRMRASVTALTPSILRELDPDDFPSLEMVFIGGEAASAADIAEWSQTKQIVNVYGPAECSDISTIQLNMTTNTTGNNIGHPLASDCWVVRPSNHNQLMPVGFTGELLIGGPKLSRCYLNNPAETARAFLNDPPQWLHAFRDPNTSSMRLYKTGDLVWYSSDGSLRFVGRKDTQIKLRGQRIEPGEIEVAIHRLLPAGSHVVADVITRGQGRSTATLVAFIAIATGNGEEISGQLPLEDDLFVVPNPSVQGTLVRINQALSRKLPKFMIPARFFVCERMPLTVSEKLDRRRLKQRAEALSDEELRALTTNTPSTTRRPPTNRSEELLLLACIKVLGRSPDSIGLDDSFFDLGGDSILAIILTQEARKHGLKLKVFDIYRLPKLSDLASSATLIHDSEAATSFSSYFRLPDEQQLRQTVSGPHIPLERISKVLPATKAQVAALHDPLHHLSFQLNGPIDLGRLEAACQRLVNRHEILRVAFQLVHDTVSQVILSSVDATVYQRVCQVNDLVEYVSVVCEENELPSPVLGAPITKFTLIQGASDKHVLIIRLCQAQYDSYSLRVLTKELKALYEDDELPEPVQFSSFIHHWFRLQSDAEALKFWQTRLQGAKMTLLPEQSLRAHHGLVGSGSGNSTVSVASKELVRTLPIEGVTLVSMINAAWAILLNRLTQQKDLTFGVVASGRNGQQSESFGCYINLIPLRTIVDPGQTVRELLSTVQKWYTESLPFEQLQIGDSAADQEQFGSVVIVQNTEMSPESTNNDMFLRADRLGLPPRRPYLTIEATPNEAHRLSLRLTACEDILSRHKSQAVIEELSKILYMLGSSLDQSLGQFGLLVNGY